ncbi:MAG: AMP-binding protein, partial [Xanthomonadaceae bacterium]|nr:AMP-binding protein [Xanthomonadaceae bacterium]
MTSPADRLPVPADFAARAHYDAPRLAEARALAERDPNAWWHSLAARLDWSRPPTEAGDVSFHAEDFRIRWYADGELNVAANCLDRQLAANADKTAILWEPDDPAEVARRISYRELHARVCRLAHALTNLGVRRGDRVTIYLPMIPEAAVAMLACARIGAVHSVVFGGFAANAVADRIADCGSRLVITADEARRGGRRIPLKATVDAALALPGTTSVETVLVVRHTGAAVPMQMPRDRWYESVVDGQPDRHEAPAMNAEDPLFILYTSGSTGKPKGVLHTSGGYLAWASWTFHAVFDHRDDDVFFCTADVGWITGHSYLVYGPLANGATSLMFEGVPTWPDSGRLWDIVDRHGVTILYTAPTAIRA